MKNDAETIYRIKELWVSLGDIPVNSDDEIEENWHIFNKGTDRLEIWSWFEDAYHVSAAKDLMNNDQ